ncbi:MAG: hypothetical protein M3O46_22020 [Myxococcota bacterium]|nr:hypothetical protein [Myxococcota bacterium]
MTTPSRPPLHPQQSERPERAGAGEPETAKAAPLQLELPAKMGAEAVGQIDGECAPRRPFIHARALYTVLWVFVLLVVLGAAFAIYVLPWYVRRQCIDVAAEHGIELSVDDAKIASDGFRLLGVHATSPDVPGGRALAPEVEVQTSELRPQKMTVHGAELILTGRWTKVESDLSRWRASPRGGQGGAWAPASLVIDRARIVWQAPIGENVHVEAAEVQAEVAWNDRDAELHARSEHVMVGVPGGALGPWRVDLDRVAETSRTRVALDPGVPEACTILIVNQNGRTTSVDAVVPRSPLAHLGVPVDLLGIAGQDLQVEATTHYAALGPARADATASGAVHGVVVAGIPRPIDIAWKGSVSGNPTTGGDVKKALLALGPLVGPVTGTLKRFDDGFRVELAWSAGPVPCAAFAAPLGSAQPFEVDYDLRKFAGVTSVKGDVRATLLLSFDSRDLGATKINFAPESSCRGASFQ